jgi:aminoglycoside phosphotransferase (APT) family kinase protein
MGLPRHPLQRQQARPPVRKMSRFESDSEPSYRDHPEVVEWGGTLIWAVDFTSGGAPIGLTIGEMRTAAMRRNPRGWAQARRVLEQVFGNDNEDTIGRVLKAGEGLSSEVFVSEVDVPGDAARSGTYAVLLPSRSATPETRAGAPNVPLLEHIARATRAIRVPEFTAVVPIDGGVAVVSRWLRGLPLSFGADPHPGLRPWEVVGRVAAAVHDIDQAAPLVLAGHATQREHGLAQARHLGGLEALREAEEWALTHLPPDAPSVLVHGDLLGQNILMHPKMPPAVIDWETATRGDPAYDLAIVTRGTRAPFQRHDGLARLLDAYAACASRQVSASAVHFHELCLAGAWYRRALARTGSRESPEDALRRVGAVLDRARQQGRGRE